MKLLTQMSAGKLKSLVDKFTAVNRVYGLLIVTTLAVDPVLGPVMVPIASRTLYCHSIDVALFFLSLSFWSNNIIIACTRSTRLEHELHCLESIKHFLSCFGLKAQFLMFLSELKSCF